MNGFGRASVYACAMALAGLLLQGQARVTIMINPIDGQPDGTLPLLLPMPLPNAIFDGPTQVSLPIVSSGFASDQPVQGAIAPLVKALSSESYQDREEATHELMRLPPDRLEDVVAALAEETDPEAISRLQTVAGHLFLKPRTNVNGDPGFLGIGAPGSFVSMMGMKFDDPQKIRLDNKEVVIVRARELQSGFPAAQELREGDCIAAIAGKGFPDEMAPDLIALDGLPEDASFVADNTNASREEAAKTMFQARVRELLPGSVVNFTVLRDGKLVEVPVQLAAMRLSPGTSLGALVDVRNELMEAFVASLKTGEKTQPTSTALRTISLSN